LEREEKRWAEYQTSFASQNPPFLTSKIQSLCFENCSKAEALLDFKACGMKQLLKAKMFSKT